MPIVTLLVWLEWSKSPELTEMWLFSEVKRRAKALKAETFALYLAARHPQTPWYAKVLVAGIVAYALSPIDLIPDLIPVLGLLDELIVLPLGIVLALKLIPSEVMNECRGQATDALRDGRPVSRIAGAVIVSIWIVLAVLGFLWATR